MRIVAAMGFLFLLLPIIASCAPSDGERCGKGFYYESGNCFLEAEPDDEPGTDVGIDSGPDDGGGSEDTDNEVMPTGLGEICKSTMDCKDNGYEADYCLQDPAAGPDGDGFCTVKNCTVNPESCATGYRCCDFVGVVDIVLQCNSLCFPEEAYDDAVAQTGGCDG